MDDLIAFLNARYEERETRAAEIHRRGCATLTGGAIVYGEPATCDCGERDYVLADVAAKRRIINEVVPKVDALDDTIEGEYGAGAPIGLHEESELLLKLLAQPFAWHPDYRAVWKP